MKTATLTTTFAVLMAPYSHIIVGTNWNMHNDIFVAFMPNFHWFWQLAACSNTSEHPLYIWPFKFNGKCIRIDMRYGIWPQWTGYIEHNGSIHVWKMMLDMCVCVCLGGSGVAFTAFRHFQWPPFHSMHGYVYPMLWIRCSFNCFWFYNSNENDNCTCLSTRTVIFSVFVFASFVCWTIFKLEFDHKIR